MAGYETGLILPSGRGVRVSAKKINAAKAKMAKWASQRTVGDWMKARSKNNPDAATRDYDTTTAAMRKRVSRKGGGGGGAVHVQAYTRSAPSKKG